MMVLIVPADPFARSFRVDAWSPYMPATANARAAYDFGHATKTPPQRAWGAA